MNDGNSGAHLIADVGGTRVRFALSSGAGTYSDESERLVNEYATFEAAAAAYLADHPEAKPDGAAVAVAGPVADNAARLTNADWSIDGAAVADALGMAAVHIVNDFAAVAYAVPLFRDGDVEKVGEGTAVDEAPRVVLGPGTGLGAAGLVPDGRGGFIPVPGEGGHMTLGTMNEDEVALLRVLRERFGHVSAERVVSGMGLEAMYVADAWRTGEHVEEVEAAVVADRARARDPVALLTLHHFAHFLGTIAADLALTYGARGGVYIAGGIPPRLGADLDRNAFRERFETKGRFSDYLAEVPTFFVTHPQPGLFGLTAVGR